MNMIEKKYFPKISTNWPYMANLVKVAKIIKEVSDANFGNFFFLNFLDVNYLKDGKIFSKNLQWNCPKLGNH